MELFRLEKKKKELLLNEGKTRAVDYSRNCTQYEHNFDQISFDKYNNDAIFIFYNFVHQNFEYFYRKMHRNMLFLFTSFISIIILQLQSNTYQPTKQSPDYTSPDYYLHNSL